MIENGLYIIKTEFLDLVKKLNGTMDFEKDHKRPVFCCIEDNKIKGLYWAIPTSDLSHRNQQQIEKYNRYMNFDKNDLRSCYYHIAYTDKKALYKISSCFPITEKYIDHEYISNNAHVIMKSQKDIFEIRRKLKKILAMEFRKHNYFPQRISDIKDYIVKDILE